jgi:hypothetical protein
MGWSVQLPPCSGKPVSPLAAEHDGFPNNLLPCSGNSLIPLPAEQAQYLNGGA